jgi:hypothetical protein
MVVFPSSERRPRAAACRLEGNGKPVRLVASRGVAHPVDMAAVAVARYDLFVSFLGQFYRT